MTNKRSCKLWFQRNWELLFQPNWELSLQLAAWLGRIAIASVLWLGAFIYLIEWVK